MKRAWLLLAALFPLTLHAQFEARVRFTPIANLTYQLDCVAGLPLHCSAANFEELWKREFLRTDEDRAMVKEWKRLRDAHASLFDKFRIAGFQATGVEDYATRLDLLTNPPERRAFEKVVRHFHPRFVAWWQKEAAGAGGEFAKQTETLLRSPKIAEPVRQFHRFYAPVLPEAYELHFNLLYVPELVKEPTSGQQLQNYSLVEFKAKERPAQRIDVAVHELLHFFYDNMPPERSAALQQRFAETKRAGATPAYNLLNEALASAFGNGMIARNVTPPAEFEKYVAAPRSFYDNAAVDRAAKALLPWLDQWLKEGRTLHDPEFVPRYIDVLEQSFGDDLLRPKLYLSEMFLFVDQKYGTSMRRQVRRTLEPASLYASEGALNEKSLETYRTSPGLSAVLVVYPDNVPLLVQHGVVSEAQGKAIQDELAARQRVLFAFERAPFTYGYVVVAQDAEGVTKLIQTLAEAGPFQGVHAESPIELRQ